MGITIERLGKALAAACAANKISKGKASDLAAGIAVQLYTKESCQRDLVRLVQIMMEIHGE